MVKIYITSVYIYIIFILVIYNLYSCHILNIYIYTCGVNSYIISVSKLKNMISYALN